MIAIIAVVAVVACGGAAAAIVLSNNSSEATYDDASQIASSFSKNYTGYFGADFYLGDGAAKDKAKAYYPNGNTSQYGSNENYLSFQVFEKKDDAKDAFETNKTDYNAQIGKTVMGGTVKGTTQKSGLTETIGYYNNYNMGTPSTYIYFTGYKSNFFFESYISLKNTSIENEDEIIKLADAIWEAVKNPVSTDQAKKYVAPTPTPTPTPTWTGVAKKCNDFSEKAASYGSGSGTFEMKADSTAMNATLQTGDEKYYVKMQIVPGGAGDTYATEVATFSAKIDTSIGGDTYHAITAHAGADDGTGYYYNATMGGKAVNIYHYTCYSGSYFAVVHLRCSTTITAETAAALAADVIAALTAAA